MLWGRETRSEISRAPAAVPDGVRVYAIGDIHGRADLLDRQHDLIEADVAAGCPSSVHLIYLGDYVDRGPDSRGVIERLATGTREGVAVTHLRGNHEEMLLRFLKDPSIGPAWRQLGGMATLLSYDVDVGKILPKDGYQGLLARFQEQLPPPHLKILTELKDSVVVGDYFFCHAGVRPGIPLEKQSRQDLTWIRDEFLTATEDFGKVVVHGHTPVDEPDFRRNRIDIDTGAYATGRLTCLVLEGSTRRILST